MVISQSFICISSFPCSIQTQNLMNICRYTDISTHRRQNLNIPCRYQCTNTRSGIPAAEQNQNTCQKKIILKFIPALPREDSTLAGLLVLDNSEHALWQKSSLSMQVFPPEKKNASVCKKWMSILIHMLCKNIKWKCTLLALPCNTC